MYVIQVKWARLELFFGLPLAEAVGRCSSPSVYAGAVSGRLPADHPITAAMFGLIERLVCGGNHPVG